MKNLISAIVDLNESQHAISDNSGYGYHGTIDPEIHKSKKTAASEKKSGSSNEQAERDKHYRKMHGLVRSLTGAHPKEVKHYLDSKHGRHLADVHNDNVRKKLAIGHVHNYIKKDYPGFKKHYNPDLFEDIELSEGTYTSKNYDKAHPQATKDKKTFITGVHGHEDEHISTIKKVGGVDHEAAKKIAHSPEYHEHAYNYRHDFAKGGSNGYDNGVKRLAGTHPHMQKEESELVEWPTDQANPKKGDNVIVKNPSSPHNNRRGKYGGQERGRHVVNHPDGTRSLHGDGAVLKESEQLDELSTKTLRDYAIKSSAEASKHSTDRTLAIHKGDYESADKHHAKDVKRRVGMVKAIYKMSSGNAKADEQKEVRKNMGLKEETVELKESVKSADKKVVFARGPNGKMVMRKISHRVNIVNAGGKKERYDNGEDES